MAAVNNPRDGENPELRRQYASKSTTYIPPFRYGFLTPFYDSMIQWGARESAFKSRLVAQARIQKGQRILDIGCGTATLTILAKRAHPNTEVIGIDADAEALHIAKAKVRKAGLNIKLDYGTALKLPFSDSSFDRVFSSMMLHHLTRKQKLRSLKETFRILKPGGELHVADLSKPQNALMYLASLITGHMEETTDHLRGLLASMLRHAGFDPVEETSRFATAVGTIALYRAQKLEVVTHANPKALDDEARYYSLLKMYARVLVPFYDTVTLIISSVRDKVADSAAPPSGSKILDLCTGTGKQAFAFAERGYDVTGVDLSEDMLKMAKKKNKYANAKFEIANATNLPFEDNSFDVSCVSFALHDMIPSVRERALKEMVRVTKPKGTVLIVDYALPRRGIRRFLFYNIIQLYEPYYRGFIESDLQGLLRKFGVEVKVRLRVLGGAGRIIKGVKIDYGRFGTEKRGTRESWETRV